MCVWILLILLKIENLLLKTIKKMVYGLPFAAKNTVQYCSFALMHMNSARGTGKKKRKEGKRKKREHQKVIQTEIIYFLTFESQHLHIISQNKLWKIYHIPFHSVGFIL